MTIPLIRFNKQTVDMLAKYFGTTKPFFVVRKDTIIVNDLPTHRHRVYFSNGTHTVTVPDVLGLNIGDAVYLTGNELYEWQSHFQTHETFCSSNQKEALAYTMQPIINQKP